MNYLPWILLLLGLALLIYALIVLVEDAKGGYDISMGAAS